MKTLTEEIKIILGIDGDRDDVLNQVQAIISYNKAAKEAIPFLIDLIGAVIHDQWIKIKKRSGCHLGDNKDCPENNLCLMTKCHYYEPYLISWDKLPMDVRNILREVYVNAVKNNLAEKGLSLE